jgi:parvulin-like peptidyl-prolyl isomerase
MTFSPLPRLRFSLSRCFPGLLLIAAVLLAGCHSKPAAVINPADPKFIVAEKGDWHVLRGDLDAEISKYLQQHHMTPDQVGPDKMPMLETYSLDNIILKKLILDRAATLQINDTAKEEADYLEQARGASTDDEFNKALQTANLTLDQLKEQIHDRVIMEEVLKKEALTNVDPTEQEIDDFYLKNKARIATPAQVRASRILIHLDGQTSPADKAAKKKAIEAAYARVKKGEDFSKVAMEVSEDRSSAPKGGDLDYFQKGENEPGFDDVAFSLKPGQVSPVFETALGYQFIKVTDIKPGGEVSLAEARSDIANYLHQKKAESAIDAYSSKLLATSGVVYHIVRYAPQAPTSAPSAPASATPAAPPSTAGNDSGNTDPPAAPAPAPAQ